MKDKNCKIVCNGKEVGTVDCAKDGISMKFTKAGKDMCKESCDCC